jgi:hypothetical protein
LPHHAIALICHKGTYKSAACQAFGEMATQWSAARYQALQQRQAESNPALNPGTEEAGTARRAAVGVEGAVTR